MWVGALVALLLSAFFIEGIPVVHAHAADEPAIYNAECVLAALAAHTAGTPLPSPVSSGIPLAADRTPDLPVSPPAASLFIPSADPRAPPTR